MASISNGSWETDLRDSVRTNFGQGWLVNGETSGKTNHVYNEGLGKANKRASVTLPIKCKKSSGIDILNAIQFIETIYLSYIRFDPNFVYSEESHKKKGINLIHII